MFARASMRIASTNSGLRSAAFTSPSAPPDLPDPLDPPAKESLPGEDRHVDGARCALPADGLDGVVHLRQSEGMRHHQFQREAVRRQLTQRELYRPIGMPARALQRDAFPRQSADRKSRKLLVAFA